MKNYSNKLLKNNIIIIIIDCLRKDYAYIIENELKNFEFISYNNVITPSPWTIPSFASLLTGHYPLIHKAHENKKNKNYNIKLKNYNNLLSSYFLNNNYDTILISANYFVNPKFGFIGFKYYYNSVNSLILSKKEKIILDNIYKKYKSMKKYYKIIKYLIYKKCFKLVLKLIYIYINNFINWPKDKGINNTLKILNYVCKKNSDKQKFILINLMELHEPYYKNENWANIRNNNKKQNFMYLSRVKYWKKKYYEELIYVNKKMKDVISILKNNNMFDNTLIIVTSDHGQLLGEHNKIGHGTYLYEEVLQIPLLIKYPQNLNINKTLSLKYISLINLKNFIINMINNNIKDDNMLYSDTVFAESYGIPEYIKTNNDDERKRISMLEKYKIAIYDNDIKGIFNVEDWKFELLTSIKSNINISNNKKMILKEKIKKFLKDGLYIYL